MGIFSEIKKMLFGAKSVTREAVKKTVNEIGEKRDHLLDVNEDHILETKALNYNMHTNEKSVLDKVKDSDVYKKSGELLEKAGDVVATTGEKFIEKTKEFAEGPGKKMMDKFGEASENIGDKIFEGGKVLKEKFDGIMEDIGEKMDETIEKAEEFAQSNKDKKSDFAETEFKVKDSELEDKEDFFNKADKFSKADYTSYDKITITQNENITADKQNIEIVGFEDADNDGDPLIDDADVINDEENKSV